MRRRRRQPPWKGGTLANGGSPAPSAPGRARSIQVLGVRGEGERGRASRVRGLPLERLHPVQGVSVGRKSSVPRDARRDIDGHALRTVHEVRGPRGPRLARGRPVKDAGLGRRRASCYQRMLKTVPLSLLLFGCVTPQPAPVEPLTSGVTMYVIATWDDFLDDCRRRRVSAPPWPEWHAPVVLLPTQVLPVEYTSAASARCA